MTSYHVPEVHQGHGEQVAEDEPHGVGEVQGFHIRNKSHQQSYTSRPARFIQMGISRHILRPIKSTNDWITFPKTNERRRRRCRCRRRRRR